MISGNGNIIKETERFFRIPESKRTADTGKVVSRSLYTGNTGRNRATQCEDDR